MGKKKKYYVVWVGLNPGIYQTWDECLRQTKGFPGAKYKSYTSMALAQNAFEGGVDYTVRTKSQQSAIHRDQWEAAGVDLDSFCVDAACSGNPGIMEYRGVWTHDGMELFRKGPFNGGTNNIGEFLALVHALAFFNQTTQKQMLIYSDSRTAMAWVRNKKVKTTLKKTQENQIIFAMIERALTWLKNTPYQHSIVKWKTKEWGEIPADFGRK